MVQKLHQQGDHRWLLIDLPDGYSPLTRSLIDVCDRTLVIVHPDGNSHIRLHQQALPVNSDILINDLRVGSQLQEDLYQLWLESQRRILPVTIHRDEAMAECLAAKQPLGEYRQDSLAAEEILTLVPTGVCCTTPGRGRNDSPEHPTAGAAGRETAERALSRLSPARRVVAV